MRKWLLAMSVYCCGTVAAAEPPLEQFASGYRLQTDGAAAIYRLPLPAAVYRTVVRPDLGDIRVFNADSERVPHAVRRSEDVAMEEAIDVELPVFPISSGIDRLRGNENLDVMVADDGAIIRLRPQAGALVAENVDIRDYIIDFSRLDRSVDELAFDLAGAGDGYIKHASLQYSDDLNSWNGLLQRVTLAQLSYDGRSLDKTSIKLPNRRFTYLRFRWLDDPGGLQLRSVRATLNRRASSVDRRWAEVDGRRLEGEDQTFVFDTGGLFPVDRINLRLPRGNTLIEAALRSRGSEDTEWHTRHSGLFYNLQVQGSNLEHGAVGVQPEVDRYWQLEVTTQGGLGAGPPRLQYAWIPNDLYFLARGQGPFTLAFGNGQAGAPGRPIEALMEVLSEDQADYLTGNAQLGDRFTLMGEAALARDLTIPWERILLWGVLVIGVVIIGVMALRLFRQLDRGNTG